MSCSAPATSLLPAWVHQSSSHPAPHQQRTYLWGSHSAPITPFPTSALQQAPVDYYGPNPAATSSQHTKFEGCGRKGHTPNNCDRKEHPNWNPAHGHVLFADTAVGKTIARDAKGTYLSCLPPSGVVWDPISQQWEECEALHEWRRKIERTRARSAVRSVPPRQLVLTIGPLPNLPASHRGLLP
jgi:hypothetical protein